jgi:hypothetical protein
MTELVRSLSQEAEKLFNADQRAKLRQELHGLNGEEFYGSINASAGWLPQNEYMIIPEYLAKKYSTDRIENVGASNDVDESDLLSIAAYNYDQLSHLNPDVRVKVSIIRAQIVMRSVFNSQGKAYYVKHDEVKFVSNVPTPESFGAVSAYFKDETKNDERRKLAELAVLAPAFATVQFMKTNHHFIDNADYRSAYTRHFRSCVKEELMNIVPFNYLFHTAIHWMGPAAMYYYTKTMQAKSALPDGIMIKLRLAPAGCALITTSDAVLKAMSVLPFYKDMLEAHRERITSVREMADTILNDPMSYHLHAELYSATKKRDSDDFKIAYQAARDLAPFTQAFLDVFARGSALSEARAIAKHADENIGVKTLFAQALRKYLNESRRTGTIRAALSLNDVSQPGLAVGDIEEVE